MQTKNQPSVSVVIPAYNEEALIGPCIESLLNQATLPLEIIVVDNNSRDRTAAIALGYQLVRVITEKRQGIVHARNAGFNAAKGDIIGRCDADSILPRNWVQHLSHSFQTRDIAAISGPCSIYDLPKQLKPLKKGLGATHTLLYFKGSKAMLGHEVLFGSNMAITQKVWKRIRADVCLDESKMHEDTDLSVHIAEAGGIIEYDPKLTAAISARIRPDTVQAKSTLPELINYISRWTNTKLRHAPAKRTKNETQL